MLFNTRRVKLIYLCDVFFKIRIRQQEALRQQQMLKDAKLKAPGANDGTNLPGLPTQQQPPSHPPKDLKEAQRTTIEISQRINKQAKPSLSLTVSNSFLPSINHSFIYSFIHSVIHFLIHLFFNLFIHSIIHSFIQLFIHSFIHLLMIKGL